jgi:hypothetical protein
VRTRPALREAVMVGAAFAQAVLVRKSRGLGAVLALALLVPGAGCAPKASPVPLGLGPLALAERDSEAQADLKRRREKPARTARSAVADRASAADTDGPVEPSAVLKKPEADEGDEAGAVVEPGASVAFEGMYAGADIAVYRLTGYPEREEKDDKAKIRIEKPAGGNVSITLINTADGSDLCELTARVDGNAALIESAQPCFSDGSEGSLEAELTSGRAVIEGDHLKMDAEGTLSGVSPPDQEVHGQLTYSFKGERQ